MEIVTGQFYCIYHLLLISTKLLILRQITTKQQFFALPYTELIQSYTLSRSKTFNLNE